MCCNKNRPFSALVTPKASDISNVYDFATDATIKHVKLGISEEKITKHSINFFTDMDQGEFQSS